MVFASLGKLIMRPSEIEYKRFCESINHIVEITQSLWDKAAMDLYICEYEKDEHLLRAGEVGEFVYFILKGVIRLFYTTEKGREYLRSFGVEGEACGSFYSSLTGTPCRFGIQALEPTRVIRARFADFTQLFETDIRWERVGRLLAEQHFILKEQREAALLLDDAETRYKQFLEDYPGLDERIAQYHIASYIGVTPVTLSRVRKKMRID